MMPSLVATSSPFITCFDWLLARENDHSIFTSDAESSFGTVADAGVSVDITIDGVGVGVVTVVTVVPVVCFFAIGCDDFGVPAAAAVARSDARTNVSTPMSFVTFFTATDNDGETEGEENVNEIIMCITYSRNKTVRLLSVEI